MEERRQTEEYKTNQKKYDAARYTADVKVWRNQCKQIEFWEGALSQFSQGTDDCLRVFAAYGKQEIPADTSAQLYEMLNYTFAQLYAPYFGGDGSISIVQHGVLHTLPRVMNRPRGHQPLAVSIDEQHQPLAVSIDEHMLALSLRCRLRCEPGLLCEAADWSYREDDVKYNVGRAYRWSAKQFGYKCPMEALPYGSRLKPPNAPTSARSNAAAVNVRGTSMAS